MISKLKAIKTIVTLFYLFIFQLNVILWVYNLLVYLAQPIFIKKVLLFNHVSAILLASILLVYYSWIRFSLPIRLFTDETLVKLILIEYFLVIGGVYQKFYI